MTALTNSNFSADKIDSESKITALLCDINRTQESNMENISTYLQTGGADSIETVSGFAFDFIPIFNGLALGNFDAVETEADTMDLCLTHSSP